jgi:tetratricopeptide (TPR) repeat protein
MKVIRQTRILSLLGACILLGLTAVGSLQAQGGWVLLNADASRLVRSGSEAMYNMRYAEADSIFNQLVALDATHPVGYFLLALTDWWRIVPNMDDDPRVEKISASFNDRIDKVVDICDGRLEKNNSDIIGLFFKGSALGYRARLTTSRNFGSSSIVEWSSALSEGAEAYDIILRCQRLAPSNSDILLGSGLYNYLGAYLPEKYPALKSIATWLPPGDKKIGISMLRLSGEKAVYASTEARYSLLDIMANMEQDWGQALAIGRALHLQYPGNSVFYKFYARSLYQTSNFAEADTAWNDILARIKRREPGYEATLARQGLYFIGDCRLRVGDYPIALRTFDEAIKLSGRFQDEESGWLARTTLRRGNVLDKMGRRKEAIKAYEDVLDIPNSGDTHDLAKRYIATPYS